MKKGDMNIPQHKAGNMAENSMGGTELLTIELFKRLPAIKQLPLFDSNPLF